MTQDSNAGERNEQPEETPRELTAQEIQHAKEMQEIADGHRYMPQEMRDARDAKPERPKKPAKSLKDASGANTGERIAKVLARAGLASRREVERLIGLGKIAVNGRLLDTPATLVKATDIITVDGQVIGAAEPTRLWRYHKPVGLLTTERDPEGRATIFEKLPEGLPRVIKVGRLDLNSEGLLLLTNDGELARALELPSSGWVRRYRARALGHTTQARLDTLKDGTTVEGVIYGPIEATLDKMQEKSDGRANVWLTVAITEGKNREVRKVLESIGLKVNRLIRLAYGPFQLGNLDAGEVEEVGPRVIRELLSDLVPLRNLPPEGASQTKDRPSGGSRFSRDKTDTRGAPEGRRGGGDRFHADKPKPAFKKDFAEKREFKDRDFAQRPRFEGDGPSRDAAKPRFERSERPARDFGDKKPYEKKPYAARTEGGAPKAYGDRPKRDFGAAPPVDRPYKKPYEKKPYAPLDIPAGEAGAYERAKREFGRPQSEQGGERKAYDRPKRDFGATSTSERPQGDRPYKKPYQKKPYAPRDGVEGGERKAYGDRPKRDFGDRPQSARSEGGKAAYKKPYTTREGADGERKPYAKPFRSDRPSGAQTQGDRPAYKPRDAEARGPKREYKPREDGERRPYDRPRPERPAGKPSGGGFKGGGRGPKRS